MKNRADTFLKLQIAILILLINIVTGLNNNTALSAQSEDDKTINTEKKITDEKTDISKTAAEIIPALPEQNNSEEKNKKNKSVKKRITTKAPIEKIPAITDRKTADVKDEKNITDKKSDTTQTTTENKPVITDNKASDVKEEKNTPDKKGDTTQTTTEKIPAITDNKAADVSDKKDAPIKEEPVFIKADTILDHPEIILNSYKEAYPKLITEVTKSEKDWIIKFANGNSYLWAGGKLLPESALPKSDKYTMYSIYPYNLNGRSPELYTPEKIEQLRVKKQPRRKKQFIPGVEGSLYKELYAITTKKSTKKQIVEVKLSGQYIKVHRLIADKIKVIDANINKLAKTDPEVKNYLKSLDSVQAFNWRKIAGTDRKSNHSFGIAIDVLPKKYRKKVLYWSWESDKNEKWMLLPQSSLWTPPDQVIEIFLAEGFIWGGHWDRYDTMHFEYRPELIALFKKIKFD